MEPIYWTTLIIYLLTNIIKPVARYVRTQVTKQIYNFIDRFNYVVTTFHQALIQSSKHDFHLWNIYGYPIHMYVFMP